MKRELKFAIQNSELFRISLEKQFFTGDLKFAFRQLNKAFLKLSFALFPPEFPFFDGFSSFLRRTRRFEIQSRRSRIAQSHFRKKSRLQIVARKHFKQLINRVFRYFASFSCKFFTIHKFLKTSAELHQSTKRRLPKRKI